MHFTQFRHLGLYAATRQRQHRVKGIVLYVFKQKVNR